jgi:hypothetical protein
VQEPETRDTFREFAIRVKGGIVALGVLSPNEYRDADALLKDTAAIFGKTIDDAKRVSPRQISNDIEYAVIDDAGQLCSAESWFPLRIDQPSLADLAKVHGLLQKGDRTYHVVSKPVTTPNGVYVGTIIVANDVTGEQQVIRQHIVFNAIATLVSWLAALVTVVTYHVIEDWRQRPKATSIEEALKSGESQVIEFKEGRADRGLASVMAAFANTNSGTIFLGVTDDVEVVGIDCDSPVQRDEELKRIRQIAVDKIKPVISIVPDFLQYNGRTVARIFVPRTNQPLCFVDHEIYVREQSSSMRATPEQVERILKRYYAAHRH